MITFAEMSYADLAEFVIGNRERLTLTDVHNMCVKLDLIRREIGKYEPGSEESNHLDSFVSQTTLYITKIWLALKDLEENA